MNPHSFLFNSVNSDACFGPCIVPAATFGSVSMPVPKTALLGSNVNPDSSDIFKVVKFSCERKIFDKKSSPKTTLFKITTEENDEFHYSWNINYSLEPTLNSKLFALSSIEINTEEKFRPGDIARVTVSINNDIFFNEEHSPILNSSWAMRKKINNLILDSTTDVSLKISIKIYRHYDNNSTNEIVEDFTKFFENDTLRDVTFLFGETEISAHKQILAARNSVFKTMFENDMLEKEQNRVEITDIELNIFKFFLQFIYSGKFLSDDFYDWLKLIVAADKYSMISLINICETRILNNLTNDNVVDAFMTGNLVNLETIKMKCAELIFKNKREVVKTDSYINSIKTCKDLGTEILRYILEKI